MNKLIALILALLSPLLFPAAFAAILVLIASAILPPVGILAGIFTDMLYHAGGTGFPYATYFGFVASGVGFVVHQFIKTRIM